MALVRGAQLTILPQSNATRVTSVSQALYSVDPMPTSDSDDSNWSKRYLPSWRARARQVQSPLVGLLRQPERIYAIAFADPTMARAPAPCRPFPKNKQWCCTSGDPRRRSWCAS